MKPAQLCGKCQYVFDHWYMRNNKPDGKWTIYGSYHGIGDHHSIPDLVKSATKNGCLLCRAFIRIFGDRMERIAFDRGMAPCVIEIVSWGKNSSRYGLQIRWPIESSALHFAGLNVVTSAGETIFLATRKSSLKKCTSFRRTRIYSSAFRNYRPCDHMAKSPQVASVVY
jgi:hypothetical protein